MFKKFLMFMVCVTFLVFSLTTLAFAANSGDYPSGDYPSKIYVGKRGDYPKYLNGGDLILVNYLNDTVVYVQKSSLDVKLYNPPIYIISIRPVYYGFNDEDKTLYYSYTEDYKTYRYDYDARQMYSGYYKNWNRLNKESEFYQQYIEMTIGEMAFYLAYRIPFYGLKSSFYPN